MHTTKLRNTRIFQYLSTQWSYALIDMITVGIVVFLLAEIADSVPGVILTLLYGVSLWTANHWKKSLLGKYIFAGISFLALCSAAFVTNLDFNRITPIIYYIPLVYACVLPDVSAPLIIGGILSVFVVTHSSHPEPTLQVIGILSASTSFCIVSALFRRLMSEREKFRQMSITDGLTGLATLGHTLQVGQTMLERGGTVTAVVIDLDHFKQVNDTYGHLIGNKILIQVANLLRRETQGLKGIVGRLGGDEFMILLQDVPHTEVQKLKDRLNAALQGEFFQADPDLIPINLSFSIGIASSSGQSHLRLEDLLNAADLNMYYNKHNKSKMIVDPKLGLSLLSEKGHRILHVLAEKDMYTYVHSQYVVQYTVALAKALKLPEDQIEELCIAGWLHDVGKLLTPSHILRKTMRLSEEEYAVIRQHVLEGLHTLDQLGLSQRVRNAIQYHHERWDGTGYPFKIPGAQTPLEGRILQITDAFSAMTIKRVYRDRLSIDEALQEIRRHSGTQFDPHLAELFLQLFEDDRSEPSDNAFSHSAT